MDGGRSDREGEDAGGMMGVVGNSTKAQVPFIGSHNIKRCISGKRSHSLLALCGSFYASMQRGFKGISFFISVHLRFQLLHDLVETSTQILTLGQC